MLPTPLSERSTSFVVKKSVVIQVFGTCISSSMGILESCRVAGTFMGFSDQVVRSWAKGGLCLFLWHPDISRRCNR